MYNDRKALYETVQQQRKHPLITYITSIRPNMSASMAGDVISQIIQQVELIPEDEQEVDLLIISNGGDPITSLRIISLLRERFKKVTVLLPYVAYSAATVLALGADEIVMHPFSNLGPVDPQLTVAHSNEKGVQEHLQFGSEDIRNYIEFLKSDVGLTDQEHLTSAVQALLKEVGTLSIGSAKRGQQLSLTLSEKMLLLHIKDTNKAKSIAKVLNSSYYHHGYAVGRKEAKDIGLPIIYPKQELEQTLWRIWQDYSNEMKCDEPFDPVREVMQNKESRDKLTQIPTITIPANTPPDLAQQIFIQQIQQIPVTTTSSLKQKVMIASVESAYKSKAYYNNIDILYWRNADMTLGINVTPYGSGWVDYEG